MTTQVLSAPTDETFFTLVDLLDHDYVSPNDAERITRLAKIVARREGVSVSTVYAMARAEIVA